MLSGEQPELPLYCTRLLSWHSLPHVGVTR